MKVMTENFNKLTKSKLGDAKPLVFEAFEDMDEPRHNISRVMDLAYEVMDQEAPEGPRNAEQYLNAIKKLEHSFAYVIRNLKGNVSGGM
jgi:aminoglycoside phosphotransferase family enzyme